MKINAPFLKSPALIRYEMLKLELWKRWKNETPHLLADSLPPEDAPLSGNKKVARKKLRPSKQADIA